MPYYENVFIARQDITSAQVDALADAFSEVITGAGGQIHRREYWGLKSLQYRIKKNRKGHYVLMNIEAPSEAMQEMERLMRLNEDVLRHLTIRTEEIPEGPSVMMQGRDRGERGDRGDRGDRGGRDGDDRPRRDSAPAAPVEAVKAAEAVDTPAEDGDKA